MAAWTTDNVGARAATAQSFRSGKSRWIRYDPRSNEVVHWLDIVQEMRRPGGRSMREMKRWWRSLQNRPVHLKPPRARWYAEGGWGSPGEKLSWQNALLRWRGTYNSSEMYDYFVALPLYAGRKESQD